MPMYITAIRDEKGVFHAMIGKPPKVTVANSSIIQVKHTTRDRMTILPRKKRS